MEIRVLRYFLVTAREQNITKAAELLHITQPTLSRQLAALEEELGTSLFIRGNKKITLTEKGILLWWRKTGWLILSRSRERCGFGIRAVLPTGNEFQDADRMAQKYSVFSRRDKIHRRDQCLSGMTDNKIQVLDICKILTYNECVRGQRCLLHTIFVRRNAVWVKS